MLRPSGHRDLSFSDNIPGTVGGCPVITKAKISQENKQGFKTIQSSSCSTELQKPYHLLRVTRTHKEIQVKDLFLKC